MTARVTSEFLSRIAEEGIAPLQDGTWDIQYARTPLRKLPFSSKVREGRTVWTVVPLPRPERTTLGLRWPTVPTFVHFDKQHLRWTGTLRRNGETVAVLFKEQTVGGTLRVKYPHNFDLKVGVLP